MKRLFLGTFADGQEDLRLCDVGAPHPFGPENVKLAEADFHRLFSVSLIPGPSPGYLVGVAEGLEIRESLQSDRSKQKNPQ